MILQGLHRMVMVRRDLSKSSSSTHLLKQVHQSKWQRNVSRGVLNVSREGEYLLKN